MNELILKSISRKLTNKKSKLYLSTLSYYAIIALIPTIVLSSSILRIFNLEVYSKYKYLIDEISSNSFTNVTISVITIYMISRIFYTLLEGKFTTIKTIVLTLFFSVLLVLFLCLFLSTYLLSNMLLETILKISLICIFNFLILQFISNSNLKYSLIFSLSFSILNNIVIHFFTIVTYFFINYEVYYGALAPVFLMILGINIFILLTYISYIGAEEFTKISNIKIVKG